MTDIAESSPVYPGGRVDAADPRYQTLIRGFNLRWVGSPDYIQVCGDTQQVVSTVQEAVRTQRRITPPRKLGITPVDETPPDRS